MRRLEDEATKPKNSMDFRQMDQRPTKAHTIRVCDASETLGCCCRETLRDKQGSCRVNQRENKRFRQRDFLGLFLWKENILGGVILCVCRAKGER